MLSTTALPLLLLLLFSPASPIKVRTRQDHIYKDGLLLRVETEATTLRCYQYTWLGPVNAKTNITERCQDLEPADDDEAVKRPCWGPLVWTVNDEYGNNSPDPKDVVEACNNQSPVCDPYCSPTGGQTCVKYNLMSNNDANEVVQQTRFCGVVFQDGATIDKDMCRSQKNSEGYNVELCSCSEKSLCNGSWSPVLYLSILVPTFLILTNQ